MYGPSGNQYALFSLNSWCFLRLYLEKHQDSRENKTNCFPREHTLVFDIQRIICSEQVLVKFYQIKVEEIDSWRLKTLSSLVSKLLEKF